MSIRGKQNDNKGYMRGAGAYSKDYASFDRSETEYSGRNIYQKVEGTGDYDGNFTGEVSRSNNHPTPDRYSRRGDGAYSKSGKVRGGAGSQTDGKAVGGQKVSD